MFGADSDWIFFFFYPLFFQESPIEININLFFQGVLAKTAVQKVPVNIKHIIIYKQSKRKDSSWINKLIKTATWFIHFTLQYIFEYIQRRNCF